MLLDMQFYLVILNGESQPIRMYVDCLGLYNPEYLGALFLCIKIPSVDSLIKNWKQLNNTTAKPNTWFFSTI